ncbi:hypothetical protein GIY23_01990 [Allosaccharopolyspora coralli]|uniref:Uncharacterized protein n=1 Tax=Allosaccharopolyspora coralli TaxID=2665642 RepID=A0A5Q3QA52_9PSEU|nr:hypothetical protein [Allosaccharopolyspora coralli]QGK68489.1 hypothetical protein GIY23_01990 [Allosaccharopolyspora coralli]
MALNSSDKGTEPEGEQADTSVLESQDAAPADTSAQARGDGSAGADDPHNVPAQPGGSTATATTATGASATSMGAGAAAVVSAGLGLSSLSGTSLGEMMRTRQEIVGTIEQQTGGGGGDQIQTLYGAPWNAVAMVNGVFALLAILVGGVVLAALAKRTGGARWVNAVALGGVALGVLGLLVAGGMYLDLFAGPPVLPQMPSMPGAPG